MANLKEKVILLRKKIGGRGWGKRRQKKKIGKESKLRLDD
jgi:hypothetical protein